MLSLRISSHLMPPLLSPRYLFFESMREQAEQEVQANNKDAGVRF